MAKNSKNSVDLVNIDQQGLMNSFKNYLRTQDEFKDFDYAASNMNVLLSLLAMNSYKNAFFLNMSFAERWIDSAQLRTSLFSQSKHLNYLPRSARSAVAKVKVNFTASGETQPYIIQKGSQFSTLIKSKSYTFTIPETIVISSVDENFEFETDIYEGVYQKDSYVFQDLKTNVNYKITNKNVDTRSLTVTVFEDGNELGDVYKLATTLLDLKATSKVFFLQTSETGHYEIIFGDDIIGQKPKEGALIVLDYRVTNGIEGNGARTFSVDFDPTGQFELTGNIDLEVIEASRNGDNEETNESIKYYAPRHFQVQERGVIATDYEIMLKTQFPEINAVAVYGGEELNPPQFGRVFIAVDISNIDSLPDSKKAEYGAFIKGRSLFGIEAIFTEPENLYVDIESIVRYNINVTSSSLNRIKALVVSAISDYDKEELNDFNVTVRESVISEIINNADESIISNILDIRFYKKINPVLGKNENFVIDFGFSILDNLAKQSNIYPISDQNAVTSSAFIYRGFMCNIEDDGDGLLRIVKTDGKNRIKVIDIGTINYETGILEINDFNIDQYFGNGLKIYVKSADPDVTCKKNNLMLIEPDAIKVEVEPFRL